MEIKAEHHRDGADAGQQRGQQEEPDIIFAEQVEPVPTTPSSLNAQIIAEVPSKSGIICVRACSVVALSAVLRSTTARRVVLTTWVFRFRIHTQQTVRPKLQVVVLMLMPMRRKIENSIASSVEIPKSVEARFVWGAIPSFRCAGTPSSTCVRLDCQKVQVLISISSLSGCAETSSST